MTTPNEENFKYYKKAETKALDILAEMKATTPKKMGSETSMAGRKSASIAPSESIRANDT